MPLTIRPDNGKNQEVTGTREWAVKTVNCCTGCSNNCRYCYAREMAVRFGHITKEEEWKNCLVRGEDVQKKYDKYDGRVMFPSTHDITPDNFKACFTVLAKLLGAGNNVLVVSKPNFECIRRVCDAFLDYKSNILFRFTIGAIDEHILSYWEPNAPSYIERKKALEYAFDKGFQTSVSAEPLLDAEGVDELVSDLLPFITDALWIGKMNKIDQRVAITDDTVKEAVEKIKAGQTDDNIKKVYARYKDNRQIKWKDSIKQVVGIKRPNKSGMDI